jgi:glutamine amidotransferase
MYGVPHRMIVIIDYGIGNLGAIENMFRRIGVRCVVSADSGLIADAARIVLPGNGAFDPCIRGLRTTGLVPLLERKVQLDQVPLLGICVGAQLLGTGSEEGREPGLGWLDLESKRLPASREFRVPHMGWNDVKPVGSSHPLTSELPADARFYFSHSYYMQSERQSEVILSCNHGLEFAAAVARGSIVGVQFHPEKSHRFGRALLRAFAGIN